MQLTTASAYRTKRGRVFSFWTHGVRAFSLLDARCQGIIQLDARCQGIFLLDAAVSGHFPSGRSRVRAFSFWMQPCQGIFLLDAAVSGQMASGRCVSWHRGYAVCQGTEHRSKYSRRIHKHAAGSRHSDSVQFYSLFLMYIYICYYHTSRFRHKHPASHPSPLFLTRVGLLSVGNKGKLANTTRCDEPGAMSTMRRARRDEHDGMSTTR